MTDATRRPWPPIITDARIPRLVVWRDRLMTAGMWLLLLYLTRHVLHVILDAITDPFGHDLGAPELDWASWWSRLQPYLIVAAVLGLWLAGWGVASLRRIRRSAGKPQPPELTLAEEAHRVGSAEADLVAWRELRVVVVDLDEQGRVSVVAGSHVALNAPVPAAHAESSTPSRAAGEGGSAA